MEILSIPVGFTSKNMIYTINNVPATETCPMCLGYGTICPHSKIWECPKCEGTGKVTLLEKKKYVVCDDAFEITETKITVNNEGGLSIRYKGKCGKFTLSRSESNLFLTKEEAQAKCDELNRKKIFIDIDAIVITDEFKESHPSMDKIVQKLQYFKENGRFEGYIVLDNNNVLKDGYINYLIGKMLNITTVKVIVD